MRISKFVLTHTHRFAEVVWTVLTFSLSRCNSAEQIYAVRFLVGLAESGFCTYGPECNLLMSEPLTDGYTQRPQTQGCNT